MCRDREVTKKSKKRKNERKVQFPYHDRPGKQTSSETSEAVSLVLLLLWSALAKSSNGTSSYFPFSMKNRKNSNTKKTKNEKKLMEYLVHLSLLRLNTLPLVHAISFALL